jgi:GNAT superfamily N-acetyltransferase
VNEHDQHRIQAYLQAISYKYQIENNAKIIKFPHITGIQFPSKSQQPWPRNFQYHLEFYAYNVSPVEVKAHIEDYLRFNPQEYILKVFSSNLAPLLTAYRNLGYLHAWTNTLMEYKLSTGKEHRPFPEGVKIDQIQSIEDIASVNVLDPDYPTSALSLHSENIYNYMASYHDEVCAKSQIITENPKYAYIADMFTHANFRRKRISASLIHTMHKKAREKQAVYSLLIPSKMTRDIELYQRYGYQEVQPIVLLVPAQSPVEQTPQLPR